MKELVLNAREWKTTADIYDALFRAIEAPSWHGRNFNALRDSIAGGDVNRVELPYRIVIDGFDHMGESARHMANDLISLLRELKEEGHSVDVVVR